MTIRHFRSKLIVGEEGPTGPAGAPGDTGPSGIGIVGPRGPIGPRGPRGPKGDTGSSGSGGGGGGGGSDTGRPYDVDNPLAYIDAYGSTVGFDEEFDRTTLPTTLPSPWVFQNQNSATYLEKLGRGCVSINNGSNSIGSPCCVVQPISSASSWEAVGKITRHPKLSISGGLILTDGTKGFGILWNPNPLVLVSYWSDISSTYTANPGVTAVSVDSAESIEYWRISKDAPASYRAAYSYDGVTWYDVLVGYDVSTILGGFGPTHFGFLLSQSSGLQEFALDWFRVR